MSVGFQNLRCLLSKRYDVQSLPVCLRVCTSFCKSTSCAVLFSSAMSTKPRVYITRTVPAPGLELLLPHCSVTQWKSDDPVPREELLKQVVGVNALYCLLTDKIDAKVLDAAGPQLKVIGTMSVGYDHIDLKECKKRNITIGYTAQVLTRATAELTMSLLLATSRRLKEGIQAVKNGEWGTWKPSWLCGPGLDGATVGIVGLGRIGMAVAQCVIPFGVSKIVYHNRKQNTADSEVKAEFVSLDKLLEVSDYVIACLAVTPETKEMFNAEVFRKMKKSAIFINTSRGGIVNQADLYNALVSGEIWAAGLDVTTPEPLPTDSPLLKLDNCIVLPHIGSATEKSRSTMAELTARNVLAGLQGTPLPCLLLQ